MECIMNIPHTGTIMKMWENCMLIYTQNNKANQ